MRASVSYVELAGSMFSEDIVRDAAVNEVSVLRPGLTPAEPGASVVLLERSSPPAVSSDLAAGEEIIHMGGRPIVRYFDNAVIEVR